MFTSFEEFKFFQSFRIPVEQRDDVLCMVEREEQAGHFAYMEDAQLKDVSVTGVGFISRERLKVGSNIRMSLQYKRLRIEVEGHIVRAFGFDIDDDQILYGVEVDSEDQKNMRRFVEQFVGGFSPDRARDCLADMALSERYKKATESFEIFSLMLSLFNDITAFAAQDNFLANMLEEITRILNAQRASIFLINPENNELEAVAALGADKEMLHFDYRKGIAGSVFTTGVPLNIDCSKDNVRFSEVVDAKTGFSTKSILCSPLTNREDKVVGVIEVLNKRNEDRFTFEDEKTIKVLSLIFSCVFHNYNPMSEKSLVRSFSAPYDREFAFIGSSDVVANIRKSIVQLKDLDSTLLICGEVGVGKKLLSRIIHNEGKRGLGPYEVVHCRGVDPSELEKRIWGQRGQKSVFEKCAGGTIVFADIDQMPLGLQSLLVDVLESKRAEGGDFVVDARMLFTSTANLETECVKFGRFNERLLRCIDGAALEVAPLRERREDLSELISYFLRKECQKQGLLLKQFSDEVKEQLIAYDWPGNVMELERAVHKAVLFHPKAHVIGKLKKGATPILDLSKSSMSGLDAIPFAKDYELPLKDRVALVEREMIYAEIKRHRGNKSKAARAMGISREALRKKLLISDKVHQELTQVEAPDVGQKASEKNAA